MASNLITLFVPAGLPQLWKDGHKAFAIKVISRTLQGLLALVIVILYAVDLGHFSSADLRAPAGWIYAEVVASLSLITCGLHYWYTLDSAWWIFLDFVLCILWTAQAGYFGTIYLGDGDKTMSEEYQNVTDELSMKAGAGIGLVCLILWLATFVQSLVWRCKSFRKERTTRKRIDRTIETVEAHRNEVPQMTMQDTQSTTKPKPCPDCEALPTYREATTTENALEKQRAALEKYDEEAAVDRT